MPCAECVWLLTVQRNRRSVLRLINIVIYIYSMVYAYHMSTPHSNHARYGSAITFPLSALCLAVLTMNLGDLNTFTERSSLFVNQAVSAAREARIGEDPRSHESHLVPPRSHNSLYPLDPGLAVGYVHQSSDTFPALSCIWKVPTAFRVWLSADGKGTGDGLVRVVE